MTWKTGVLYTLIYPTKLPTAVATWKEVKCLTEDAIQLIELEWNRDISGKVTLIQRLFWLTI